MRLFASTCRNWNPHGDRDSTRRSGCRSRRKYPRRRGGAHRWPRAHDRASTRALLFPSRATIAWSDTFTKAPRTNGPTMASSSSTPLSWKSGFGSARRGDGSRTRSIPRFSPSPPVWLQGRYAPGPIGGCLQSPALRTLPSSTSRFRRSGLWGPASPEDRPVRRFPLRSCITTLTSGSTSPTLICSKSTPIPTTPIITIQKTS